MSFQSSASCGKEIERAPSLQLFRPAVTSPVTDCTLSAPKFGEKSLSLFSGKADGWPLGTYMLRPRAPAGWAFPGPDATISGREGRGS